MPVPKEVIGWLDEEDEALAHHDLLILSYKIVGRLQQQNTEEAAIAGIMHSLAPLDFLAHGKKPQVWGSVFSPKSEAEGAKGSEEAPKLARSESVV